MLDATFALLMTLALPTIPHEHESLTARQEECFAIAMIGYDYVVNSRAGLPIERALNTVRIDDKSPVIRRIYRNHLSTIVTNAYRWQNTPHTYAIKVLHDCAFSQGREE